LTVTIRNLEFYIWNLFGFGFLNFEFLINRYEATNRMCAQFQRRAVYGVISSITEQFESVEGVRLLDVDPGKQPTGL